MFYLILILQALNRGSVVSVIGLYPAMLFSFESNAKNNSWEKAFSMVYNSYQHH